MDIRESFTYFMCMQYSLVKKAPLIALVISSLFFRLSAAGDDRSAVMGSQNAGISAVSLSNVFAAGHNQAATAFLDKPSVGVMYSSVYLSAGINNFSLSGVYPFKKAGALSLTTNYFGYSAYRDISAGIGYSIKLAKAFSIGAQLDLLSTAIAGYGTRRFVTFEFGMYALPLKKLAIGAHIYNPLRQTIDDATDEKLPTIIKAGLTYMHADRLHLTAEYKQDLDADPIFSISCFYQAIDKLSLRVGFNSQTAFAFGFGIHLKELTIDIGSSYRHPLGFSPYSALDYAF